MSAGYKWFQLFLDIATYEIDHSNDGKLLTDGAHSIVRRYPICGRAVILFTGLVVTLHLAKVVNPRCDLMSKEFWQLLLKGR